MGEILAGAVFLGASTSLPGILTSVSTAWDGFAGIAIGNALGGLTAQTAFLAIADIVYRRGNLEHAAASVTGLSQATLLVTMMAVPLLAATGPAIMIGHVHIGSIMLFVIYGFGVRLLMSIEAHPMWRPVNTDLTVDEKEQAAAMPDEPRSTAALWRAFALYASITAVAGYAVGQSSIALVGATGVSETAFGTTFTAVANSLPELVTAIAAVRIGAVNLAVGDVIGGNAFEVLFLAASDFAFLDGSIYGAFTPDNIFTSAMVILMTGVLILGLLNREKRGFANIGWESVTVLGLFGLSTVVLFL